MNQQVSVENGLVIFSINIRKWSANRKLRQEHTRAKTEDLPPSDLISLGVRKIFDTSELTVFEAIRKETERLCWDSGTKFFGGTAIPRAEADTFLEQLDTLKARFDKAKAELEDRYDQVLNQWRNSHQDWAQTLEGTLERDEAMSRFHFSYSVSEITVPGEEDVANQTPLGQKLAASKTSFLDRMYQEIAEMATDYRNRSLLGKEKATVRGLSSIETIRKKLNGLSFMDKRVTPLVKAIDAVLERMPPAGGITGPDLASLFGLTSILSDQDTIIQFAESLINGEDHDSLINQFTAEPEGTVVEVQQVEVVEVVEPVQESIPETVEAAPQPDVVVPMPQPEPAVTAVSGWGFIPSRRRARVAMAA